MISLLRFQYLAFFTAGMIEHGLHGHVDHGSA
jgi:hypothetical protein